jgi:hypothetical protein
MPRKLFKVKNRPCFSKQLDELKKDFLQILMWDDWPNLLHSVRKSVAGIAWFYSMNRIFF